MLPCMPSPLVTLARRKAALSRIYGCDDERTLAAASALRRALLERDIGKALGTHPPMTDTERAELAELLLTA